MMMVLTKGFEGPCYYYYFVSGSLFVCAPMCNNIAEETPTSVFTVWVLVNSQTEVSGCCDDDDDDDVHDGR